MESKMLSAGSGPSHFLTVLTSYIFPPCFSLFDHRVRLPTWELRIPKPSRNREQIFKCCNCAKCDWQVIFGHLHETSVDLIEIQEWFDDRLERNGLLTSYQVPFHRAGCKKVGTMACKAWICLKRFWFRSIGVILIELYKSYTMNYPNGTKLWTHCKL